MRVQIKSLFVTRKINKQGQRILRRHYNITVHSTVTAEIHRITYDTLQSTTDVETVLIPILNIDHEHA